MPNDEQEDPMKDFDASGKPKAANPYGQSPDPSMLDSLLETLYSLFRKDIKADPYQRLKPAATPSATPQPTPSPTPAGTPTASSGGMSDLYARLQNGDQGGFQI